MAAPGAPLEPAEHFASLAQETHAQRLGIWIFLASEVLLFAGLFALYGGYRLTHPQAFAAAIRDNTRALGSVNTLVLLTSSLTAALGVHAVKHGRRRSAMGALLATVSLALAFLAIKITEYAIHYQRGAWPGRASSAFEGPLERGEQNFWNLYFLVTGVHAVHVVVGSLVLLYLVSAIWRGSLRNPPIAVEAGVLYWHLVDLIWIFVWPLFYLTGGHG
jgi:cytochrome c oxidase subunit III